MATLDENSDPENQHWREDTHRLCGENWVRVPGQKVKSK
jgi:hypothetical protein